MKIGKVDINEKDVNEILKELGNPKELTEEEANRINKLLQENATIKRRK